MSKDPAINWYFDNWSGGTEGFTRHQKGCYMDLLKSQYFQGHLSLEKIKNILNADFSHWNFLKEKFLQDEHGNFFNERLDREILKRKNNSEKQSEKVKKRWNEYRSIYNSNTPVIPNDGTETETGIGTGKEKEGVGEKEKDLTPVEIGNVKEFIERLTQKRLTTDEVLNYWQAFLLGGQESAYHSISKKISHFRYWTKDQILKNGKQANSPDTSLPNAMDIVKKYS